MLHLASLMGLRPLRDQVPWAYYQSMRCLHLLPIWYDHQTRVIQKWKTPKPMKTDRQKWRTADEWIPKKSSTQKAWTLKTSLTYPPCIMPWENTFPRHSEPKKFVRWESSLNHAAAVRELTLPLPFFSTNNHHSPLQKPLIQDLDWRLFCWRKLS